MSPGTEAHVSTCGKTRTGRSKRGVGLLCIAGHRCLTGVSIINRSRENVNLNPRSFITTDNYAKRIKPTFFCFMGHLGLYKVNDEILLSQTSLTTDSRESRLWSP